MPDLHPTHPDEFLSVPEVAEHLAVDVTTVRRWIKAGLLPGTIRTSPGRGDYRIPLATVRQFEKAREVK